MRALQASEGSDNRATSLSSWRDLVRDTLIALHYDRPGGGPFTGRLSSRDLLDTRFVQVSAVGHRASSHATRLSRYDREYIHVSLLETGHVKILQGDRMVTLLPGDIAIFDAAKPYHFVVETPFVQTVLKVHREDLAKRLPNIHDFTVRRIDGNKGAGRIASTQIREVYGQIDDIGPECARTVQRNLLEIVACAVSGPEPGLSPMFREHQHLLLRRIMWFVEENLFHDDLTCESVARAVGISERYLRKLCSTCGYSLSERILNRRLEEASQRLSFANAVKAPITSIAYDCGFKDTDHFSRAFKARFGMTPRDFRNSST